MKYKSLQCGITLYSKYKKRNMHSEMGQVVRDLGCYYFYYYYYYPIKGRLTSKGNIFCEMIRPVRVETPQATIKPSQTTSKPPKTKS